MPEIDDEVTFEVSEDKTEFTTQTNGDRLLITGISLEKEQAATLAYLVNSDKNLVVTIKEVV